MQLKALRRTSSHSDNRASKPMKVKRRQKSDSNKLRIFNAFTKLKARRFDWKLQGGVVYLFPKPKKGEEYSSRYFPSNDGKPQVFMDMCVQIYRPGDADIKPSEAKRIVNALSQQWEAMYDTCHGLLVIDWENNDDLD
jgi:hypothetical protein